MDIQNVVESCSWHRVKNWHTLNPRAAYAFVQDFLREDDIFKISKDSDSEFESGTVYFFGPSDVEDNAIRVAYVRDCSNDNESTVQLTLPDTAFRELCGDINFVNFFAIRLVYKGGTVYDCVYHLPNIDYEGYTPAEVKKSVTRDIIRSSTPMIHRYPLEGEEYECTIPALRGDEGLTELAEYIGGESGDDAYQSDDEVIIDGVFREIEEEVYGGVEVEDYKDMFSIVSNVVFIDENGYLVKNYEDFSWTGTLDYLPTDIDFAAAPVNNKVVITSKFAVTADIGSMSFDDFLQQAEALFVRLGVAMGAFLEVSRGANNTVTLYGQLCAAELACSIKGVTIKDEMVSGISQLPLNGYAIVKLGESDGDTDELQRPIAFSCMTPFTRRVVKLDAPVDYLYRIPHTLLGTYTQEQLVYIYMMSLDRFNCIYVHEGNIYLPPFSKNSSENTLVPLYKEIALCYLGCGSRDRLYSAMNIMCSVEDINLPAAAYLCPIEFLNSVGTQELKDYILKVFKLKRPIDKNGEQIKSLKKAKTMQELLECITTFEADEMYPVSTIGLFASNMQEIPMFKQLAGCTDADLLYQLVQEMVQVLCKKEPKALAAVLMAHRSTLTPEQKEQAIKAIKKNI